MGEEEALLSYRIEPKGGEKMIDQESIVTVILSDPDLSFTTPDVKEEAFQVVITS